MRPWKEHHYTRAAEFVHLFGDAVGLSSANMVPSTGINGPRPLTAATTPKPAAPTAAAMFKSIPWKK